MKDTDIFGVKALSAVGLFVLIVWMTGCSSVDPEIVGFQNRCAAYGFEKSTNGFRNCVMTLDMQSSANKTQMMAR